MSRWVVFLGGETLPWLRIEDGAVAERGDDLDGALGPVTAIAPASAVTYRNAAFEALSPAQALAAARLDSTEASLGADRHVAIAETRDHYAVTERASMRIWIDRLALQGLSPSAIIPAPSLLTVPDAGFIRAELPHEAVLRSADAALAEDKVISPLIVGDAPVATLGREALEAEIVAASDAPTLNLLQGEFAPRTDWSAETGYGRRMAILAAILLALTIAIPVAQWARIALSTAALDRESATIAAGALGEAKASDDAVARLEQRLIAERGGGAGFLPTQAALISAVEAVPGAELGGISFDPDGTLRSTLRVPGQPELDAVKNALAARGFAVTDGTPANVQGRLETQFQVRPL